MKERSGKRAIFIDGLNLHVSAKTLGFDIDYRRLLDEFRGRDSMLRAYYYTTIIEDQEVSLVRPLLDWLDYNGFTVVTKAIKEAGGDDIHRRSKSKMAVEIAVGILDMAYYVEQMILFSGDGDFRSVVEAVQRRGVHVTVISTVAGRPPMAAEELRRQADDFIDLLDLRSRIGRVPSAGA